MVKAFIRDIVEKDAKTTVVVIGGGAAGVNVVHELSSKLDPTKHRLILITARNKYVYLPAALRVLVVEGTPMDLVLMPYDTVFGSFPGELKIGSVSSIEASKSGRGGIVVLATGEKIYYDTAVLATGSIWEGLVAFPNNEEACEEHIQTWRKKFKDANEIVIAGGGAVGIETAGEIKDAYPNKSVTIVQGDRMLLNDVLPDKFRKDIEQRVRARGVNIIFNDIIQGDPQPDIPLKTRNGLTLKCDLFVKARGGRPNTSFMSFLQPSPLTERGYVKVLSTLQVDGHPGLFALGDIIDWAEIKQFAKIVYGHKSVVVANLLSHLDGKAPHCSYKGTHQLMAISNGKNGGASYWGILWGIMFGDYITKVGKSKDLMIGAARRGIGLPASS